VGTDNAVRAEEHPPGPAAAVDVLESAPPLRLVIVGSVDDGKSTLVGRLLVDTKSILADQHEAIERASRSRGSADFDLALLTDGLRAEREQGITIDVAYRYFATPRRSFILADTPGHVQYTRNAVTGASTADAAVVLVDVRNGVVEQTRRHAAVLRLLRVPHVIVAVNKMDAVGWSAERFAEVAAQVATLGLPDVRAVPISALTGTNVAERDPAGPDWYDGPALLPLLESIGVGGDDDLTAELAPLRLPVQLVIRPRTSEHPDYRGLAGRVASGVVQVGDKVASFPGGLTSRVVGIDTPGGPVATAVAGQSVTVRLADELDIGRGAVLAPPDAGPTVAATLDGVLCWLGDTPSQPNRRVLVKAGTAVVRGALAAPHAVWDFATGAWRETDGPAALNDLVRATVRLAEPVAVDDYVANRATGGFLVIDPDTGVTLAAGLVGDPLGADCIAPNPS
jgi:sulfate adenylyltransferase subunit 1